MPDSGTIPVKCLVWDLDDTLWRGVLSEQDEVALLDPVRQVLAELDSRGILHAVSSKNDHDLAWARLTELGVAEYFVAARIGWGRKSDAVRELAGLLEFAENTIAFIDDQPAERAEVAFHLPDVRCYPAEQAELLPRLPEFTPPTRTADAGRRRARYQANLLRNTERNDYPGPDEEFLKALDLQLQVVRATKTDLQRVEELTLRTSQMNATGVHYSATDLEALLADPRHEVLVASLADRFGSHGAIGIVLLSKGDTGWHLKLLATSCRVVSFGVGAALLDWLADQAAQAAVHLVADFRRTDRNRIMEIAYRFAGFTDTACDCARRLPAADGIQRLHLAPARKQVTEAIHLTAPDLGPDLVH
ncbi:HAD family hydrolase [Kibdelosporangium persicum]|uniref:Methoxymalonate biosynthesis protein hbmH n=1 Tax=Kibdelosporangium persicum TaxID=2698649 RepID=A0ABX2FIW9_9PSEU|nr:HAD-IIIC family phosphatase [Kibdelosporangium persicum]NRN71350.1 Methoxymalonate biosynthesis protein hbmH [Kibdelosporangium persicum]